MKKKFITAIAMLIAATSLMAQQIPLNSSTYFMRMLNNPALTAYNGSTNVYGYYRDQWTGMPGHPVTMGGMGEISLWGDRSGLGVAVSNDVTSIISNVSAQLYYAQKIKLAQDHHLSLGVSFGLLDTHIDYANAIATDVNDPNILSANKTGIGFDMNVGIAYQWKKLTIGFAVPHVVNTNVTLSDQTKSTNYDALRNYVAHASYEFSFKHEMWNLEPSILFRQGTTGPVYQIEGNVMANYKRMLFLGVGYRQDYGMSVEAAVRISRCVTVGYSFEYPITGGATFGNTRGTHEVLVGINFDKWIKDNKKQKRRMDSLEAQLQQMKHTDTALSKRIDSLQDKTKQLATDVDENKQYQELHDKSQENKMQDMTVRMDTFEKQLKEYKDLTAQKPVTVFSDMAAPKGNGKAGAPPFDGAANINKNDIYKMDKVYFEKNSSYLKKESYDQLNQLLAIMKANPQMKIKVLGHTDYVASDTYNMWLSERRAKRVADYLIANGIPAENVSSIGFGKRSPVADNSTEEGRALNRRVEIQVITK